MSRVKSWELRGKYRKIISSTSYLTHGIHPYTAKLIPHIPRYFIEKYTYKDEVILDPFCGSGTTAVVSKRLRRKYIGIEINKEYYDIALKRLDNEVVSANIQDYMGGKK